jgi:hypothetical protein
MQTAISTRSFRPSDGAALEHLSKIKARILGQAQRHKPGTKR